ncbi:MULTISPECIES: glycosyltransferase [unclassified Thermosipho (in: thermotogales)]|uniref:glycosyltransferase n=1 Tax=unclassified Thermosipho (in: thermotogales) TaxID=2676525 RepID=UPI0018CC1C73|nr:glycosyltransferase [Thermosipho sp. 1223]MBT1247795.1 hypothetical protein [Thermosipho sp. 1244]
MNIKKFLANGEYKKIIELLDGKAKTPDEYNALGLAYYSTSRKNKAILNFKKALSLDPQNLDALFNLAEMFLQIEKYPKAKEYALKLLDVSPKEWMVHDILAETYMFEGFFDKAAEHINEALSYAPAENLEALHVKLEKLKIRIEKAKKQKRLAIICLMGLDNFIDDIIKGLSDEYWIQRWAVRNDKEIKASIDWADIVWFEWANEAAVIGTNYPGIVEKKVLVRLHSYEVFTNFPLKINWNNVNKIIFVAPHMREILKMTFPSLAGKIDSKIIYNGIDLERIPFMERSKGYNIAWVAHISYKKNPAMILQVIKKLTEIDKRYKIHIAGDFQDSRYELYLKYMVEEMGLKNNVIFYGWVDDMEEWWRDKNYVLSTSIHEGHPYNIMEAMARGIKPVIHNFYGAKELYEAEWLFSSIDEAVDIIKSENYNSIYYRQYVINRKWTVKDQVNAVKKVLNDILVDKNDPRKKKIMFDKKQRIKKLDMYKDKSSTYEGLEKLEPYLKGEYFDKGLVINYNVIPQYKDLKNFIESRLKDKRVLHIGFADHKDIIGMKIKSNQWIHNFILKVAREVWGIDIDCEAVRYLKDVYGIQNIICANIENYYELPDIIKQTDWDSIVVFDVIEHLQNPIKFLKAVKKLKATQLVVSAPNAYRWENIIQGFNNMEIVNTDHKYWFSGFTLMKTVTLAGFKVKNLVFLDRYLKNIPEKFSNSIFRDTVLVIAEF